MSEHSGKSLIAYARVAGFAYLAVIITSILNLVFVESKLVVDGDPAATTRNITANVTLFRVGLIVDLVMFAGVVLLSLALYVVLRTVNRNLALLALLWRMTEAVIGGVTVLVGMFVVLLLSGNLAAFEGGEVQALVDLFLRARATGFDVVVFFLCLGTIVYCHLLWKSRYVPRLLAGLGIASFFLMLMSSLLNILTPDYANLTMLLYAPGIIFELAIGAWLAVKGVNPRH